jgi:hypothetical protein
MVPLWPVATKAIDDHRTVDEPGRLAQGPGAQVPDGQHDRAWLVRLPEPLTQAQIDQAQKTALAAGLSVETRATGADLARLADNATGTGIAVALGILAMTVGLIRSETARDLHTLTATGARRGTRRTFTATTAGALALAGALIGTGGAYLALLAWYHSEAHWLGQVPVSHLAAILIGLPVIAYTGAWLVAGRETPALGRQPLDRPRHCPVWTVDLIRGASRPAAPPTTRSLPRLLTRSPSPDWPSLGTCRQYTVDGSRRIRRLS